MAKRSKRYIEAAKLVDRTKYYPIEEAIEIAKKANELKFDASLEVAFNLGVDTDMRINNYVEQLFYQMEQVKLKKY